MRQDVEGEVLAELPLATSVLQLLGRVFESDGLDQLYDARRGSCYERVLTFPAMIALLSDALLGSAGSAREALIHARERGALPTSLRAFYDKLRHMPIAVSSALVPLAGERLRELLPRAATSPLPPSLGGLRVLYVDGKVVKHVPHRLKPLRPCTGAAHRLLGGRALVLLDGHTQLAVGFEATADGEAHEVTLLPAALRNLPDPPASCLIVADRAFGFLEWARLIGQTQHFLLRMHTTATCERDASRPAVTSRDRYGRVVTETWGWLVRGAKTKPERLAVRRLAVTRDQDTLVLVTSLEDPAAAPADDLLEVYLHRWGIERVFQDITQVFDLRRLIGTTPEATLFQLSFCLAIYNVIQTVKTWVARSVHKPVAEVSGEMLFRDVRRQLTAALLLIGAARLAELIPPSSTADMVAELANRLSGVWRSKYQKCGTKARDPSRPPKPKVKIPKPEKGHDSVFRILQKA